MKRNRFSGGQIIGIPKEREAGVATANLCRQCGVSSEVFCTLKMHPACAGRVSFLRMSSSDAENKKTRLSGLVWGRS